MAAIRLGFRIVDTAILTDLVRFSAEGPTRQTVFETDRLWVELICVDQNQEVGPMSDPQADAAVTVIAGEVVVHVGRKHKRLSQWGAALVPAGTEVIIKSASVDPSVVLLMTAPPPERAV